jgi:FMN phosphatase YigB (HAD superfamily)
MQACKGIIFDLDGTLYHMKWYLKPLITLKLFPHSLRLPRYMAVRDRFAGRDMGSAQALLSTMASQLSAKTPGSTTQQMEDWIWKRFYSGFETVMPFFRGSRKGITETLAKLHIKGIRLAVLSDYGRIEERLAGLAIAPRLFDNLVSAESVGSLKPSPRAYIELSGVWGIEPGAICVIGDRDDTDGIAAKAAGMQFIRISDKKHPPAGAKRWTEIKRFLDDLPSV